MWPSKYTSMAMILSRGKSRFEPEAAGVLGRAGSVSCDDPFRPGQGSPVDRSSDRCRTLKSLLGGAHQHGRGTATQPSVMIATE